MVVFDDSAMTMMQINLSPKTQWELDEVNYVQSGALGRPTNPDDEDGVGGCCLPSGEKDIYA